VPKKSPAPTPTELVVAGQPSAALAAELKRAGEKVTIEQLAHSLGHLEAARVGFVAEATATGILLLAKKQTLKHGQWQKFAGEVWSAIKAGGNGVSDSPGALDNFTRSLRGYTFLAQHFLADLEQNHFQPEAPDVPVVPPAVKPAEVLALDTLPQEKRIQVYNAIERFVAGRSLRRMLMDFRRAESAADQEELEEEANRRRKTKKPAGNPGQMDFFGDMQRPLDEIDRLMEDTAVRDSVDAAYWLKLAAALDSQANQARAIAKEYRAGGKTA